MSPYKGKLIYIYISWNIKRNPEPSSPPTNKIQSEDIQKQNEWYNFKKAPACNSSNVNTVKISCENYIYIYIYSYSRVKREFKCRFCWMVSFLKSVLLAFLMLHSFLCMVEICVFPYVCLRLPSNRGHGGNVDILSRDHIHTGYTNHGNDNEQTKE